MANEKRQRQKEARNNKSDEIARLARQEVIRQRIILVLLIGVLVAGAAYLLTRDSSEDSTITSELQEEASIDVTPPTTADPTLAEQQAEELLERMSQFRPPPAGATITGETPCPAADGTSERTTSFENPPPMCIDPALSYTAVISTDYGDMTVELDPVAAPETVNNFVVLARYGYYQDVPFHRIIPEFVIQGGDAVGRGEPGNETLGGGNPGYAINDELPADAAAYTIGSLAMANSGPNSSGSQFFIVTGEGSLDPLYSLFGQVTEGMDVVDALNAIGTPGQGVPTDVVNILSVTITEA